MGRASLNWSLDRLAEASRVHRNTISNFETGKFAGDPETLAAIEHALVSAGVIFESQEDSCIRLRRFLVGDLVRFRSRSRIGLNFKPNIGVDEIGEVIGVEPHPPETGPTYRIEVQFSDGRIVPYAFKTEYELVKVVSEKTK
jgi:transcriptional regulator with XRE-family HTH domain